MDAKSAVRKTQGSPDLNIRIINAATGEVLRDFELDPTRDYQPTGAPKPESTDGTISLTVFPAVFISRFQLPGIGR